ncbi:ArsR/SmtB family transcription factor [Sphingobium naphthae]|uniref:Metalloregulator ArsR/SmtB family transcription factor n=1 Tax=Sphingobium naphthae TaxID=1886786 RepID=A0ABU3ZS13_9SPHN|nr:metalloregulator ArsR/SmtB family transcription factor [Sphingobium naphthae]MDV5822235.1 metalloregulator ArsR/SmtB family transcription factor [Sphingobium naphthae]PDH65200.1 MAG: transcriptional regulator [Sphingomonadaceae bacterium MED-G03]
MSQAEPAVLFAALGDATRLGLLARLADGGASSIARLADGLPLSRQAVAKHLDVLQGAGLIHRRRQGRETQVALRPEALDSARAWLDQVGAQWDERLACLRALVEGDG